MYGKLKEKLKEKAFNTKELEMEKILNRGIYHLLYNTSKEVNDIDICILTILKDLKKLLL